MEVFLIDHQNKLKTLRDIKKLMVKMETVKINESDALPSDQLYPTSAGRELKSSRKKFRTSSTKQFQNTNGHLQNTQGVQRSMSTDGYAAESIRQKGGKKRSTKQHFQRNDITRCSLTTHTGTQSSSSNLSTTSPRCRHEPSNDSEPNKNIAFNSRKCRRANQTKIRKYREETKDRVSDSESGFHSEGKPVSPSIETPRKPTRNCWNAGYYPDCNSDDLYIINNSKHPQLMSSSNQENNSSPDTIRLKEQTEANQTSDYDNLDFYRSLPTETLKNDSNSAELHQVSHQHKAIHHGSSRCVDTESPPVLPTSLFSCSTSSPLYFSRPKFQHRKAYKLH